MTYDQADYFLVPLLNGQFGVGQVFEVDTPAPFCALTGKMVGADAKIAPLALSDIIAFTRIAPTALTSGTWPLAGFDQIPRYRDDFDYVASKALGFKNQPAHDPAIIEAFLSAWHGLYDWAAFGGLFDQIKRAHLDRPAPAA